ncbi:MAG: hypothetical protein EP330_03280 [Deltaproteobacteria bacterium]|nr:MAG: hypothetical protein EP330_03280 [Deltaproteobacteria bacterium]
MHTLLALLLLPSSALAAEVTDMPTALRGDVNIDYVGAISSTGIEEAGEIYARRQNARHELRWGVEFAPADGLAITLAADTTPYVGQTWKSATSMGYDPVRETGTYTVGSDITVDKIQGRGFNGIWIGAALQPFNEAWRRNHQTTWRIDLAYRTGNKNATFWTEDGDGWRGAAPGGPAYKLSGAFSADNGAANPYVVGTFKHEGRVTVDVADASGTVVAPSLRIQPGTDFDLIGGIEVVGYRDADTQDRFAVDLRLGVGYRSYRLMPSGLYLPDVLDASKSLLVTQDDRLVARAGMGFDTHIRKYVSIRVGGDFVYNMPYRIEHLYEARTSGNSYTVEIGSRLNVRIR